MKRQILLCLLIVSGQIALADENAPPPGFPPDASQAAVPIPAPATGPAALGPSMPPPTSAVLPAAGMQVAPGEPLTAPPTIVGPNGSPLTSQYQPPLMNQPGPVMQPAMPGVPPDGYPPGMMQGPNPPCASCGQGPAPGGYGPYGAPFGSPGALVQPGMMEPLFPYKALTPDVTMVPTTANGPLPDRYGWVQRYELGVFPFSEAKNGWDRLGEWAFDLGLKYTAPLYPVPAIFSFEQQYGLRLLTGPSSPPGTQPTNLPGSLQRIGWDFELKTANGGPLNAVVGFNPSIDSDFQRSLTGQAINWDGRAAFLYSPTRELTYVAGILLWDRLHERVLPWAGVIYRPNQYWQFDMVFPQFRVSTFLWDEFGFKTSLYGRVEYHSEAYEISNPVLNERDRVQFDDWRALIGVNKDRGDFDYFVEAGWIFGRHIDYDNAPQGFQVDSGAIIRAGVRF